MTTGESTSASLQGMLVVEQFLQNNYLFRCNVLNGKVEFVTLPAGDDLVRGSCLGKRQSRAG